MSAGADPLWAEKSMKKINLKSNKGYTIIETMISVSLFLVIVMAGMSALLNANLLHEKSNDMRSIMDNLSFIMEDMSRNLRTGYDYHCFSGAVPNNPPNPLTRSCEGGEKGISFMATTNPDTRWVYKLGLCDDGTSGICKSVDGSNSINLAPAEIEIDQAASSLVVIGAEPPNSDGTGDTQQPFATIRLSGTIKSKGGDTSFSLQTSVSQRQIDI